MSLSRVERLAVDLRPEVWALIGIAVAVLLANALYLMGILDGDPLGPQSGLVVRVSFGFIRGQTTADPNVGFVSQALSHRAALDVLGLHLPWWNPYEGTGAPLAGEMQSAALFPPMLLTVFQNGQLYEHMLLELLAGGSTFFLLRRIGVGLIPATAGGIAFALNGTFAWFGHAPVNPIPFLPLALLGVERARSATLAGRPGGWRLFAISGALSFYAGFPETAYLDALLVIVWFAWRCGTFERAQLLAFVRKVLTGALAGLLLCAPLLIAMLDYFVSHADLGPHAGGHFSHIHVPAVAAPQIALPYVFGPIFGYTDPKFTLLGVWGDTGGFLTFSLVLLAVLGLVSRGRRGLRAVLAVWIVLVVSRIYGVPGIWGFVDLLPGMRNVSFYRYCWPALELAVIVLAALGLDASARGLLPRRRVLIAGLAALVGVAGAALAATSLTSKLGPTFSQRPYFPGSVGWAAVTVAAITACALASSSRVRRTGAAAILVLDVLAMFVVPELSAPRAVTVDTAPVAYLRQHLGFQRFFTLGPVQPNYGSYYGLASLNINDIPVPSRYARFIHSRTDAAVNPIVVTGTDAGGRPPFAPSPSADLVRYIAGYRDAAVSYVVAPRGQSLPRRDFRLSDRTAGSWIYRVVGARPYMTARGCSVHIRSRTAASVTCPHPSTLIRRETSMPGWQATIDGHSQSTGTSQGIWQTAKLPAGTHTITFSYAPPHIDWGWLAFVLGLLACPLPGLPIISRRCRHVRPSGGRIARRSSGTATS